MATVTRYLNTNSPNTAGGDGTTNGTSGTNRAFFSMADAAAAMGGSATDDYILECCGSAADTTAVTWNFGTDITTGTLTIRGYTGDSTGKYDGNALISTGHYRLAPSAGTALTLAESGTGGCTVDGIQIECTVSSTFHTAILFAGASPNKFTIKNNRIRKVSGTGGRGIGCAGTSIGFGTAARTIENNLIVNFAIGIEYIASNFFSRNLTAQDNTIYAEASGSGLYLQGTSTTQTAVCYANIAGNCATGKCIDGTLAFDTYEDNAFNSSEGTTGEVALGTDAATWTSAGTGQSADFTLKDSSSAPYNIVNPTRASLDITRYTRDGTNHDAGCFELQTATGTASISAAGAATATFVGSSRKAAAVSAAGASTATFRGQTTVSAPVTSAGAATATFIGRAAVASRITAGGTSTVTFVGSATTAAAGQGVLSSAGAGAATFRASTAVSARLAIAGTSSATFRGADATTTTTATVDVTRWGRVAQAQRDRLRRQEEQDILDVLAVMAAVSEIEKRTLQ